MKMRLSAQVAAALLLAVSAQTTVHAQKDDGGFISFMKSVEGADNPTDTMPTTGKDPEPTKTKPGKPTNTKPTGAKTTNPPTDDNNDTTTATTSSKPTDTSKSTQAKTSDKETTAAKTTDPTDEDTPTEQPTKASETTRVRPTLSADSSSRGNDNDAGDGSGKLSGGAIAGIAVGAVAVVLVFAAIVGGLFYKKHKERKALMDVDFDAYPEFNYTPARPAAPAPQPYNYGSAGPAYVPPQATAYVPPQGPGYGAPQQQWQGQQTGYPPANAARPQPQGFMQNLHNP